MSEQPQGRGIGYSARISDPAYARKAPQKEKGSLKYLLFVVPLLVFVALWQGQVIGTWLFAALVALSVVFMLPPILKERREAEDRTFDGTITSVERREPVSSADIRKINQETRDRMIFHTIRIKDEQDKQHTFEQMGGLATDLRTYYQPGGRVRHHKGFMLPEKYDKSQDEEIICIICGRMNAMDSRKCSECGAPLLK